MPRRPRPALPAALLTVAALLVAALAASLLPVLAAGAAPADPSARQAGKCAKRSTAHARRKCHKPKVTPTATVAPTAAATSSPSPSVSISASSGTTASSSEPAPASSTSPATVPGVDVATVSDASTATAMKPAFGVFGLSSEYSRDLSSAPQAQNSAQLVSNLAQQVSVRYGGVAAFNVWNYNVATYTVSAATPRTDLIWDNCQHKTYTPAQLYTDAQGAIFKNVPIPANAIPAAGTDGELSIYSPSTDQEWELWKANKQSDGWHACWGGRIDNTSSSKGFFSDGTGATATGLSAAAGSIGIAEAQALSINHAMSLMVVDAANWTQFSYPAQRSDGSQPVTAANAIEEGQRFRLDPALDLSTLKLTPLGLAIAKAAQKYGFIVDNKSGAVGLAAESGAGVAAAAGSNPWTAILGATPSYSVLKNFPWSQLQALPLNYGK